MISIEKVLGDALTLFTTIDPIGTLMLFVAVTARTSREKRASIARRATIYSAIVLLASMVLGQVILKGMGVRLISLQVAGGVILFLFGLKMIFGDAAEKTESQPESGKDLAVFPLAVPSIAGPGAIMASIVLTDNDLYSLPQQLATGGVLLLVLALTYLLMRLADPILKVIGNNGSAILIRVMGMLLAALSVELVMDAIGVGRWVTPAGS